MSILKSLTLVLLLNMPMIAMASTITHLTETPSGAIYFDDTNLNPGDSASTFLVYDIHEPGFTPEKFTNTWTLSVGSGESAVITFNAAYGDSYEISDFRAGANNGELSFSRLTGTHTFTITGTPTGASGGGYEIETKVSAVPLPATAWLMASALIGLVSFGRRKKSIAA